MTSTDNRIETENSGRKFRNWIPVGRKDHPLLQLSNAHQKQKRSNVPTTNKHWRTSREAFGHHVLIIFSHAKACFRLTLAPMPNGGGAESSAGGCTPNPCIVPRKKKEEKTHKQSANNIVYIQYFQSLLSFDRSTWAFVRFVSNVPHPHPHPHQEYDDEPVERKA